MDIAGLPLHPLVVHAAVVLVPLTMIGALVVAFWSAGRQRYGMLIEVFAAVSVVAVVLATTSGGDLLRSLSAAPPILADHQRYGSALIYPTVAVAMGLGLLLVSDWMLDRAADEPDPELVRKRARTLRLLGVVIVVMSAVTGVTLVFLTGHSGAYAVWG